MKKQLLFFILFFVGLSSFAQLKVPQMVFVKGGTFKMGSAQAYRDEMPQHQVTLSDYYIGKYEVTVAQYKQFCASTGRKLPAKPTPAWYEEHDRAVPFEWVDEHPMVYVTYNDAINYCKWLSEKTGDTYTLPTEAQWEFAAKGGILSRKYKYAGSNNLSDVGWYDENTQEKGLKPVGQLKPNELGIYDMSGNAWEWCLDYYGNYTAGSQKDPQGPKTGQFRVIRGGSWYYVDDMARLTSRDGPKPNYTNYNYGFRVVKIIKKK